MLLAWIHQTLVQEEVIGVNLKSYITYEDELHQQLEDSVCIAWQMLGRLLANRLGAYYGYRY
jgi:hypothetical protein